MTNASHTFLRLLAIVSLTSLPATVTACAHRSAPGDQPAPAARGPAAVLRVFNYNSSDVKIYLLRGSMRFRLGMVTSAGSATFDIPPDFLGHMGDVTLVASPIGSSEVDATPLLPISGGDVLQFTVDHFLAQSHLIAP